MVTHPAGATSRMHVEWKETLTRQRRLTLSLRVLHASATGAAGPHADRPRAPCRFAACLAPATGAGVPCAMRFPDASRPDTVLGIIRSMPPHPTVDGAESAFERALSRPPLTPMAVAATVRPSVGNAALARYVRGAGATSR